MSASSAVIRVENLSKRYIIDHNRPEGEDSFRDMLGRRARRLASGLARGLRQSGRSQLETTEEFWALKDVSFDVGRGEVVGIVGRNGAGKSTILKILSRITEPSAGRVTIRGRVASLLEVGTGFHGDLTGRENIFLNGAILGMTQREIRAKFDEIVSFAEIEKFLDTPVKRYSSGMYVRLAFAVAAHLEPEILIVDEVLAVGDIAFQKKCLGKMENVATTGRTVLFVSHNLPAVASLTHRAILVEQGQILADGAPRDIISQFLRMAHGTAGSTQDMSVYRRAWREAGYADIESVSICGETFGTASVPFGADIVIEIGLNVTRPIEGGVINIVILNEQMEPITTLSSMDASYSISANVGRYKICCNAGPLPLIPGEYRITIGASPQQGLSWDVIELMPGFRIEGDRNRAWQNWPDRPGVTLFDKCQWQGGERLS